MIVGLNKFNSTAKIQNKEKNTNLSKTNFGSAKVKNNLITPLAIISLLTAPIVTTTQKTAGKASSIEKTAIMKASNYFQAAIPASKSTPKSKKTSNPNSEMVQAFIERVFLGKGKQLKNKFSGIKKA